MSTYTPTKQLLDLDRAINDIALVRSNLAVQKTTHQAELSRLNDRVRTSRGMPGHEYEAVCRKQNEIKGRIRDIEAQMAHLKNDIRSKEVLRSELKADAMNGSLNHENSSALQTLREKYKAFAADATRVSSMRQMAAQFVMELDAIAG